jgi:hypothetical protein
MGIQIDKNKLIQAMKDYVYVSTESGPVVPSKTKVIKMLTKQTPKPVSKPQDSADWDHRTYDQNKPLTYGKNLITTRDLYKKVFTEAVSNKNYRGMRMNLASIDMKETHCKFIINRRDHDMLVELFYPNENDNITVSLTSDTGLNNLYEVQLDSPQFINNFGYTILKTCDQLIDSNNTYDVGNDLDTMQYVNGLGNGTEDISNSWHAEDSAIYHEAVSSELGQLLNLCNAVALLEDGEEQDPNAQAFAAAGDEMPNPDDMGGMNPGDVNGTEDSGQSPDESVNFKDGWIDLMTASSESEGATTINADGTDVNGKASAMDNLAKMYAEARVEDMNTNSSPGVKLSKDEILHGTAPAENQNAASLINGLCSLSPYISLAGSQVPKNKISELIDYLNNPGTDDLTLTAFNEKLNELFPNEYDGGKPNVGNMSTSGVDLPGEDQFDGGMGDLGGAGGFDMNDTAALDDMGAIGGDVGGEMDFNNDGSFASMMDQAAGPNVDIPSDEGDIEFGADNGPSQQAVDKQDEVIGAMTNL